MCIRVRRIVLQMSSDYPWKNICAQAFHALRSERPIGSYKITDPSLADPDSAGRALREIFDLLP